MINAENKPTDWRLRGTPNPITSLGDDRWANNSAEISFKLEGDKSDNYVSFGVRYLTAEPDAWSAENGYSLKICPGGYFELKKNTEAVQKGNIDGFDTSVWHTVRLTAWENHISAELDGAGIAVFDDESGYAHSGRISIGSGLYNNIFDNLKISPVDGELLESAETKGVKARQCFYCADVPEGSHDVKIVVTSGRFAVDVIEY